MEKEGFKEEQRLVERSKAGDEAAFAELFKRYRRRLLGVCFQIIGDQELAEDLSQETFLHAYKALATFHMQAGFYTWLYRIAVNLSINAMRKQARQRSLPLNAAMAQESSNIESPAFDALEQNEIHRLIESGLQQLPAVQRDVMRLFDLEGQSYEAIAKLLGINPGTVRSRLHYARKRMRAYLSNYLRK